MGQLEKRALRGVKSSGKISIICEVFIMSAMYILSLASLTVAVGFLIAFLWAVKSGQFEDKYTPKVRILFEDKKINTEAESNSGINKES